MRRSTSSTPSRDDAAPRASCGSQASASPKSWRSDHPLNSVRHELRLHGLCEEIVLDPFSEAEVAEYVAQRSPSIARDEAFVRALHERTDGVPLFVASVTRDVVARARTARRRCVRRGQLAKMAVPEQPGGHHRSLHRQARPRSAVRARGGRRLRHRVPHQAPSPMRCSVTSSRWVMRATSSCANSSGSLRRVPTKRTTPREPPYSFRHALFRQVLYERTAPATRSELHRRVGSALERQRAEGVPVAAAELAMHFERGREPMKALSHYVGEPRSRAASLQPRRMRDAYRARVGPPEHAAEGDRTRRARSRPRHASRRIGFSGGRRRAGSEVLAPACVRAAQRCPAASHARLLLHELGFVLCMRADYDEALAVAKRAESLSSDSGRSCPRVRRVHRARRGRPASGPSECGPYRHRARARCRGRGRGRARRNRGGRSSASR